MMEIIPYSFSNLSVRTWSTLGRVVSTYLVEEPIGSVKVAVAWAHADFLREVRNVPTWVVHTLNISSVFSDH